MRFGNAILAGLLLSTFSASALFAEGWGDFKGKIVVKGTVPAPSPIDPDKDKQFCGKHKLVEESLVVGKDGGLQNCVVLLFRSRTVKQEPKVHPSYAEAAKKNPVLDNKGCRFEPHVMTMTTAQKLKVTNSDAVGHNANVQSLGNPNNPQIPPGGAVELDMKKSDNLPAAVVCGAHPWMKAVVLVRDEPYTAVTNANGEFEIKNLPDGEWIFAFWHERGGKTKQGGYLTALKAGDKDYLDKAGQVKITVKDGQVVDAGVLSIESKDLIP